MNTKITVSLLYNDEVHDVEIKPVYGLLDNEVDIVYYEANIYNSHGELESSSGNTINNALYNLIKCLDRNTTFFF